MLPIGLRRAIELLSRLPGVGEKTAARFVMHLLSGDRELARALGEALRDLDESVVPCSRCGAFADATDGDAVCAICADARRDDRVLCVVARVQDLLGLERSGAMRGRYFVLHKLLSPLDGVSPRDLPVQRLVARVADGVDEVILATPPTVDGEATALFLARELRPSGARITRLASGVPHGGDLEFADQITLGRALEGRKAIE